MEESGEHLKEKRLSEVTGLGRRENWKADTRRGCGIVCFGRNFNMKRGLSYGSH